jgi:hypothetical protein
MSDSNSHRQLLVRCVVTNTGAAERVNRINIAIYDHQTSFCNTVHRSVPSADSPRAQELLLGRIALTARQSDDVIMEIDAGMAGVGEVLADLVNLGCALTDSQLTSTPE